MRSYRCWRAAFSRANTVTYGATAFEEAALLQLLDVWSPGIVATDSVVVHQKYVFGHFEHPNATASPIEALLPSAALDIQRILRDTRSRKHRELGKGSTEPFSTRRKYFLCDVSSSKR